MAISHAAVLGAIAAATLLAQGAAAESVWRKFWGLGDDPVQSKYEELFGQPYQQRPFDIFDRAHPFYEVQEFERAEDMRTEGVSTQVDESDKGVTLSIYWPGSSAKPLDVTVDGSLVHVRPSPAPAEQNGPYHFYASRLISVPVPKDAKAESAKVTRQADLIRVDFEKR